MNVYDLLKYKSTRIYHTTRNTPLPKAIDTLNYYNIGALPVMNGDQLVGIISERDVLQAISKYQHKMFELTVEEIMTRKVITCETGEELNQVMNLMTNRHIRHLPVIDQNKLVGIISIGDVVKALLKKTEQDAQDLRDYLLGRS